MELKKPREIALKILNEVSERKNARGYSELEHTDNEAVQSTSETLSKSDEKHQFIEDKLEETLQTIPLSDVDRRLIWELCLGVKKWQLTLDWLIARKTRVPARQYILENILRLGVYQIIFLTKIPDYAAVNETVKLTQKFKIEEFSGLVNAVLRSFVREKDSTRELVKELKRTKPHIGYSHPEWLYERWKKVYGEENAVKLLKWNNIPPKTYARLNTLRVSADILLKKWQEEKVRFKPMAYQWTGENLVFELKSHPPLGNLESLRSGWFYIQDPSTLFCAKILEPKEGEKILDYCSAPGGKTTYIAQLINNNGLIIAYDTDVQRLKLLNENLQRLGVSCCKVVEPDEVSRIEAFAPYDRVLVDAPCSNTGVMRRRIELRWRIKQSRIKSLKDTQIDILTRASKYVKKGGALVYSTCSIEPEENREVVETFLNKQTGWRLDFERQLTPFSDGVDGAYVARLIREE